MPAPIPLEPPVTRATLPLNDFVCIWPPNPPGHALCHIMDCSVQNEHSAGPAHIRTNGRNDKIICMGNLCPAPGKTMETRAWFIRLPQRDQSCEVGIASGNQALTRCAFVGTNPTDDSITSGLPVIQTRSVRPAWSLPRLCGFITADTAGRLLLLLVKHLLYVESDVSVATNIVVTHLRMPIGIRNAT